MEPFNKREKKLILIVSILCVLALFLSFKIVSHKISIMPVDDNKYAGSPTMEDSIKTASMIFMCTEEANKEIVRYRIQKILYKDADYQFPYDVNDFFPELEKRPREGFFYGEELIVILSTKSSVPKQTLRVMRGIIPGFKNIKVDEFIQQVKTIKKQSS